MNKKELVMGISLIIVLIVVGTGVWLNYTRPQVTYVTTTYLVTSTTTLPINTTVTTTVTTPTINNQTVLWWTESSLNETKLATVSMWFHEYIPDEPGIVVKTRHICSLINVVITSKDIPSQQFNITAYGPNIKTKLPISETYNFFVNAEGYKPINKQVYIVVYDDYIRFDLPPLTVTIQPTATITTTTTTTITKTEIKWVDKKGDYSKGTAVPITLETVFEILPKVEYPFYMGSHFAWIMQNYSGYVSMNGTQLVLKNFTLSRLVNSTVHGTGISTVYVRELVWQADLATRTITFKMDLTIVNKTDKIDETITVSKEIISKG